MPDYSKGKIYTIRFHNSNEIYIGSTTQSLAVRFGGHKRTDNSAVYKVINNKYDGNWEECYYELYENYSCNNKEELCKKEGEIIRKFKDDENYDCLNHLIAGRTDKEYYSDNINIIKDKMKLYKNKNKEQIKEQSKIYYQHNVDKIKEKDKDYYDNNKEKILEKQSVKVNCDCGSYVRKGYLSRHYKSKIHQNYLLSLPAVVGAGN